MKKTIIIGLILIMILMQASTVFAANSFNTRVVVDKTTINPGDEILVSFSVSDIDMGENGMNTIEATLQYDKNVFEEVTSSNITSETNWSTTYNSSNGKLLSINFSNGVKNDTKIFTIKMKAKSSLEETKQSAIKLVDITSNDGIELVNVGTKTLNLTVRVEQETDVQNVVANTTTNTITTNTITNTTEDSGRTSNVVTNTQANTPIPQAGISPLMMIVITIVLALITVTYVRYKVLSKDIK